MERLLYKKFCTPNIYKRPSSNRRMALPEWTQSVITYVTSINFIFNKVVISLAIFLIGLMIGRLLGNFVRHILKELEINRVVRRATSKFMDVEKQAGMAVSYLVYFFAAILALDYLGVATPLLLGLLGFILVIIVLALLLGAKDYIPNFLAGITIYKNELFLKGDVISVDDITGKVVRVGLVETELKSADDRIFIPNSTILKKKVRVKRSQSLK